MLHAAPPPHTGRVRRYAFPAGRSVGVKLALLLEENQIQTEVALLADLAAKKQDKEKFQESPRNERNTLSHGNGHTVMSKLFIIQLELECPNVL